MRSDYESAIDEKIKKKIYSVSVFFFEGIVIYVTVFASMMWVTWHDIALLGRGFIDDYVFELIVKESFYTTISFFSAYAIIRIISYTLYSKFSQNSQQLSLTKTQLFVIWTFTLSMLLVTFAPMRLILQDIILDPTDKYVTGYLVKFNFDSTITILTTLGIVAGLLLYIFRSRSQKYSHWMTITPIAIGVSLSFFNFGPDYIGTIYEARAAWKDSNYELLFQKGDEALSISENNQEKITAYYWMAVSHNLRKQYQEATEYHKKALALNPNSPDVLSSLSYAQSYLGQYEESLKTANKCIEIESSHAWCYNAKAVHYVLQGMYEDAEYWYKEAVERDPESRELLRSLEWVQNVLRERKNI